MRVAVDAIASCENRRQVKTFAKESLLILKSHVVVVTCTVHQRESRDILGTTLYTPWSDIDDKESAANVKFRRD